MQKISQQNELTHPNKANILTQMRTGRERRMSRATVCVCVWVGICVCRGICVRVCKAICNHLRSSDRRFSSWSTAVTYSPPTNTSSSVLDLFFSINALSTQLKNKVVKTLQKVCRCLVWLTRSRLLTISFGSPIGMHVTVFKIPHRSSKQQQPAS